MALAIAGKMEPAPQALDPGLALFAGYVEEPDLDRLRRVLKADAAMFEQRADVLIRSFAEHLRGFRQASRASIVRTFIQRAGRIRMDDERIVVTPEDSPYQVALHIGGMDGPIDALSWVGGRRLEFEVGNL